MSCPSQVTAASPGARAVPVAVRQVRNGIVESEHRASIVHADVEGWLLHVAGDASASERLLSDGRQPTQAHHMCSGQHTIFLLLARLAGWAADEYWRFDHPAQVAYREVVATTFGVRAQDLRWAVDGCGVPTYASTLRAIARAFALLADPAAVPTRLVPELPDGGRRLRHPHAEWHGRVRPHAPACALRRLRARWAAPGLTRAPTRLAMHAMCLRVPSLS